MRLGLAVVKPVRDLIARVAALEADTVSASIATPGCSMSAVAKNHQKLCEENAHRTELAQGSCSQRHMEIRCASLDPQGDSQTGFSRRQFRQVGASQESEKWYYITFLLMLFA